jgi:hypothetical protein
VPVRLQRRRGDAERLPSMAPGAMPMGPLTHPCEPALPADISDSPVRSSSTGSSSGAPRGREAVSAEGCGDVAKQTAMEQRCSALDHAHVCMAGPPFNKAQGNALVAGIIATTFLSALIAFLTADDLRWLVNACIFR